MANTLFEEGFHKITQFFIKDWGSLYKRFSHQSDHAYRSMAHKGFFFAVALCITGILMLALVWQDVATMPGHGWWAMVYPVLNFAVLAAYQRYGCRGLLVMVWHANILAFFLTYRVFSHQQLINADLPWVVLITGCLPMMANIVLGGLAAIGLFTGMLWLPTLPDLASLHHASDAALSTYAAFGFLVMGLVLVSELSRYNVLYEAKLSRKALDQTHKNLLASMRYADGLRNLLLHAPESKQLLQGCIQYFNQPMANVSGDFFYTRFREGRLYLVMADCTGHGVPGAFLSGVGICYLDEALDSARLTGPAQILDFLRTKFAKRTAYTEAGIEPLQDGMECAIVCLDFNLQTVEVASSYLDIGLVADGAWVQVRGNRYPLTPHPTAQKPFTETRFSLLAVDRILLWTDGMYNQYSATGQKLLRRHFLRQVAYGAAKPQPSQTLYTELTSFWHAWRGGEPPVDDASLAVCDIATMRQKYAKMTSVGLPSELEALQLPAELH